MFTYDISKDQVVEIWSDRANDEAPLIRQESFPNGESWSLQEAESWATAYVNYRNDLSVEVRQGTSRATPLVVAIRDVATPEDIEVANAEAEAPAE